MQQRAEFIGEWSNGAMSFTALCDLFKISRQTGYKWVRRWRDERSVT
jgi:transposase